MEVGRVWSPKDSIFYPLLNVDSFPVLLKAPPQKKVSPNFELFHKDLLQRIWFGELPYFISSPNYFFVCRFSPSLKGLSASRHFQNC